MIYNFDWARYGEVVELVRHMVMAANVAQPFTDVAMMTPGGFMPGSVIIGDLYKQRYRPEQHALELANAPPRAVVRGLSKLAPRHPHYEQHRRVLFIDAVYDRSIMSAVEQLVTTHIWNVSGICFAYLAGSNPHLSENVFIGWPVTNPCTFRMPYEQPL